MKVLQKAFNNTIKSLKKMDMCMRLCLILAILALIIILYNKIPIIENFETSLQPQEKYEMKENNDIYDDFYVSIYDQLVYSDTKNNYEISALQDKAFLSEKSILLDVGSGTGRHCSSIEKNIGCSCTGIDNSEAMVTKAKENSPNSKFVKGNVLNTMSFQGNTFTHITVFYFTIYYIKDKLQFFKNAYHWLKPGGYLIIHLVNKYKFDPIIPAGDPLILVSAQKYAKKRITNTSVKFDQFNYKANFDLVDKNKAYFDEKFIFSNNNVRHNKHVLWMDDQNKILGLAKDIGFILNAKIDLTNCQYERQFLYILQKPN